jgi:hypothetical protein
MPAPVSHETCTPEELAEAAIAMGEVLAAWPSLKDMGLDVPEPESDPDLCDLDSLAAFLKTREWLRQWPKVKAVNRSGTSYGLKHIAEAEIGYITNGVFIAAAIAEGFCVERCNSRCPNAWLNITARVWSDGFFLVNPHRACTRRERAIAARALR